MKEFLDNFPLASVIALIVVIVGAVIVIINPDQLSFEDYLVKTGVFLGGIGVLGVARSTMNKG